MRTLNLGLALCGLALGACQAAAPLAPPPAVTPETPLEPEERLHTFPAPEFVSPAVQIPTRQGTWSVSWEAVPHPWPAGVPVTLEGRIFHVATGKPVRSSKVAIGVDALRPGSLGEPCQAPEIEEGRMGQFEVQGLALDRPGPWRLVVSIQREDVIERAFLDVEVR